MKTNRLSPAARSAQEWLARFLSAEIDSTELEAVRRDDVLFVVVARVERAHPDWLKAELSRNAHPTEAQREVYRCLRSGLRHVLRARFTVTE